VEGCLMQILRGLVRVRPRLAWFHPHQDHVELTGVVWCRMWGPFRLRPTMSTCNLGGGRVAHIKLHPHVGVVRPYHHLHMCDELVTLGLCIIHGQGEPTTPTLVVPSFIWVRPLIISGQIRTQEMLDLDSENPI
jgi:hypothetical protein